MECFQLIPSTKELYGIQEFVEFDVESFNWLQFV
jgi:hypothetical protein